MDFLDNDTFTNTNVKLFKQRGYEVLNSHCKKITIVGISEVGMALVLCILTRGITRELCYIDLDKKKLLVEMQDFRNANYHLAQNTHITCGSDFSLSADSDICVITLTLPYSKLCDEDYLECYPVIEEYVCMFKKYIPPLIEYNPHTVLFVITRPNSILTYCAWRLSKLPKYRVFGIGTQDQTSKYRNSLAKLFHTSAEGIRSFILGQRYRGFPLLEVATNKGFLLRDFYKNVDEMYNKHMELYKTINDPSAAKDDYGFITPSWGLALTSTIVINAVLFETGEIFCLNVYANGLYGIDKEVFLSVPTILSCNGVSRILTPLIRAENQLLLKKIADDCHDVHINLILINDVE